MTERNFNVAHNEELTPSVQSVKTFSGASHKTLARYVNDTESTMTQSLDVSIACQRFQLAGIIVLADGENFSSTNLTATAYKNNENRKYQLATETISLPATNAGNMGYVAATMSGYEDFVDSIAFSGTITIAAGGNVTIIALFKGGEDSALANLSSKIDEIADNTAIQQPYRLFEVDSNRRLTGNTQTKKKIDLCGATDLQAGTLGYYAANNQEITGAVDLSSLIVITGSYALTNAFKSCANITSADFSSLKTVSAVSACLNIFSGCTSLSSINLNSFETLSGASSFSGAFSGTALQVVNFPKLSTLSASSGLLSAFSGCSSLTDVYFNALTTTSFGSQINQFASMLSGDTDVKLHFPSNLTATIAGLTGYPNFGGTNTQVLFDLPATE